MKKLFPLFLILLISCGNKESSKGGEVNENLAINNQQSNLFNWETSTPEEVGMDPIKVEEAIEFAFSEGSFSQAVLVVKNGKIMAERYRGMTQYEASMLASNSSDSISPEELLENFGVREQSSLVTSWSTGKSFTSILIGIAIDKGFINSVEDSASNYITEWQGDNRASITLRNLLDMRSSLIPTCGDSSTTSLYPCNDRPRSGGTLVYADDQLTACLEAQKAEFNVSQPWSNIGIYESGHFRYSNCDTQILGEILFRATGKDPYTFADIYLFSKLNMTALWWRDNVEVGQSNGNYLTYCCLDSTIRDFAKFGQMILNGGELEGQRIVSQEYIDMIKNIVNDSFVSELAPYAPNFSYGLKFWTIQPAVISGSGTSNQEMYPPANSLFSTIGFDGQYVVIDFERNMIIARNSLYHPYLNHSNERKMKLIPGTISDSNWIATVPAALGIPVDSEFSIQKFLYLLDKAVTN